MNRILLIAFLSFSPTLYGGPPKSIFDDDGQFPVLPTTIPVKNTESKPPISQDPPKEKPAVVRQAPSVPLPPIPAAVPSTQPLKLTVEEQKQALQDKAERQLAYTKVAAEKRASNDPDYIKAVALAENAHRTYETTKLTGTIEEKCTALSAMSQAIKDRDTLYHRLVDGDMAYQNAKIDADVYIPKVSPAPPVASKEIIPPEIADAIANRYLVEGMSLKQAKQSARIASECVYSSSSTKVYRWLINGRTGYHTVTEKWVRNSTFQRQVADYGIVGYVEATFVDDKLTTFQKYRGAPEPVVLQDVPVKPVHKSIFDENRK